MLGSPVDTKNLTRYLQQFGVSVIELHGDLDQRDRDEALLQFTNGSCRVMVATDVAARGLDIKNLPLVIAYELAHDADTHVHRIGRTGRAGEKGLVLCLVASREMSRLDNLAVVLSSAIAWTDLPAAVNAVMKPSIMKALAPVMQTLVIDAGRQDKLRPGDILGALTGAAELKATQIGKIDVFVTRSYVAIEKNKIEPTLQKLRDSTIKGRRFRIRKL